MKRDGGNKALIPGRQLDPNIVDRDGDPLLTHACWVGHVEAVRRLLEMGADPNRTSDGGRNAPLAAAARKGGEPLIHLLLEHGADLNHVDRDGESALSQAVYFGNLEAARALLAHGIDMDRTGGSALLRAVSVRNRSIAAALLEHGADANARDADEDTPLLIAVREQDARMVKLLLRHGADPDLGNREGMTARDRAGALAKLFLKRPEPRVNADRRKKLKLAARFGLPREYLEFIVPRKNRVFNIRGCDGPRRVELHGITGLTAVTLRLSPVTRPGKTPRGHYEVKVLDLAAHASGEDSRGFLVWIPDVGCFGTAWEGTILVFREKSWAHISKKPGKFFNARWLLDPHPSLGIAPIGDLVAKPWEKWKFVEDA